METYLKKILASLNCIEVKGRENMDLLLGVILAVESMLAQLDTSTEDPEEENNG